MSNTWKSRYPGCFVSFPSVTAESKLDYELLKLEEE